MLLHNLCNKNNVLLNMFIIVQVSVCVELYNFTAQKKSSGRKGAETELKLRTYTFTGCFTNNWLKVAL